MTTTLKGIPSINRPDFSHGLRYFKKNQQEDSAVRTQRVAESRTQSLKIPG